MYTAVAFCVAFLKQGEDGLLCVLQLYKVWYLGTLQLGLEHVVSNHDLLSMVDFTYPAGVTVQV